MSSIKKKSILQILLFLATLMLIYIYVSWILAILIFIGTGFALDVRNRRSVDAHSTLDLSSDKAQENYSRNHIQIRH